MLQISKNWRPGLLCSPLSAKVDNPSSFNETRNRKKEEEEEGFFSFFFLVEEEEEEIKRQLAN